MHQPIDATTDQPEPAPASGVGGHLRHDLASPLTTIRCHAQLARQRAGRLDGPAADRERLATHMLAIEDAVDRIVALLFPERAGGAPGRPPPDAH